MEVAILKILMQGVSGSAFPRYVYGLDDPRQIYGGRTHLQVSI